jgi:hypothetical protein
VYVFVYFAHFLKITELAKTFGPLFRKKFFSQTHLITLPPSSAKALSVLCCRSCYLEEPVENGNEILSGRFVAEDDALEQI